MLGQKFLRVAAAAIIFFFALAPRSEAQVLYGSIVGTLTDPTGSAVPEATITITNKETGQTREAKSDAQGNFNITNVMPGRYDVRIAATGFRAITQQNLDVTSRWRSGKSPNRSKSRPMPRNSKPIVRERRARSRRSRWRPCR
jgi:hypothetical protein